MEENKVEDKSAILQERSNLKRSTAISAVGTTAMMSVHWLFIWG